MILRVDTQVLVGGATTRAETHYKITSLSGDEVSPQKLMRLSRGHWGVENKLHFIKDRWWDEDRQWSRRPGLAERLAMIRDSVLTALRLVPGLPEDLPIRAAPTTSGGNCRRH